MNSFHIQGVIIDIDEYDVQIAAHRPKVEDKDTGIKHDGDLALALRFRKKATASVLYSFDYKTVDDIMNDFKRATEARGVYHENQLKQLHARLIGI